MTFKELAILQEKTLNNQPPVTYEMALKQITSKIIQQNSHNILQ